MHSAALSRGKGATVAKAQSLPHTAAAARSLNDDGPPPAEHGSGSVSFAPGGKVAPLSKVEPSTRVQLQERRQGAMPLPAGSSALGSSARLALAPPPSTSGPPSPTLIDPIVHP